MGTWVHGSKNISSVTNLSNGNIFLGGYDGHWAIIDSRGNTVKHGILSDIGNITASLQFGNGNILIGGGLSGSGKRKIINQNGDVLYSGSAITGDPYHDFVLINSSKALAVGRGSAYHTLTDNLTIADYTDWLNRPSGGDSIRTALKLQNGNFFIAGTSYTDNTNRWQIVTPSFVNVKSSAWAFLDAAIFDSVVLSNGNIMIVGAKGKWQIISQDGNNILTGTWSHGSSDYQDNINVVSKLDGGNYLLAGSNGKYVILNENGTEVRSGVSSSFTSDITDASSKIMVGIFGKFELLNATPTISLTNPTNNRTLYENDLLVIDGTVTDTDVGNSVTVRYQIGANTVRAIKAFVSTGAAEAFSKTLTFRSGNLYDGDTLIASGLVDGVPHTLKVYATDDQGGQSPIVERTFYVVPNRAPSLTIDTPNINGSINNDKFTISGTYNDADNNTATVHYRINGSNSIQVAEGTSGTFDFDVSFGQLVDGPNTIVVEVQDSYGAKTSKTIKLTKNKIETPLLRSTERYKINPPTGSAKAVLLWVQRNENLEIDTSISMGMKGEAENFELLTPTNTAPIENEPGIVEDEFYIEKDEQKDNIILQVDMTRTSIDVNDAITLIQGVLE